MSTPRILLSLLAAALLPVLGACATVSAERVERDIAETVSARAELTAGWHPASADDRRAAEAIRRMLADELTLDEAVAIALVNNHELRAALAGAGIARADLVQAGLLENPSFGFSWRDGDAGIEREFSVFQDFLGVFTLAARRNLAAHELERARLEVAQQALDLIAQVKQTHYALVADRQAMELYSQVLDATEAAAELAARQYRAGTLSLREQALHQSFHAQAALEGARAEARFGVDRERLNRLLGLWGADTAWTLPERLPDIPAALPEGAALESRAVSRRLDLAAHRKGVEAVNLALDYTRQARWLSALGIGFKIKRDTDGTYARGPAIELGLPLFDRGQARLARLQAELQQAEAHYAQRAVDVRAEVREAFTRMQAAHGAVMHYRHAVLPLAERVVDETLKFYNGMLVGVYELLAAKHSQIGAAREYIAAWRDYWVAWTELERAIGGDLALTVDSHGAAREASDAVSAIHLHGDH
jgi:cobalt-zinc-cadmium efflux system outer membrane protein